jgi:hypothetical protein
MAKTPIKSNISPLGNKVSAKKARNRGQGPQPPKKAPVSSFDCGLFRPEDTELLAAVSHYSGVPAETITRLALASCLAECFSYKNQDGVVTMSAELPNAAETFRKADWLKFVIGQSQG